MRTIFSIIFLTLCFFKVASQTPGKTEISALLDTIETYSVSLSATYGSEAAHYYVNGIEVEKRIYDRYRIPIEKSYKCKPCIFKNYNADNELISITTQYLDCSVGTFTIFYSNGRIKVKGQHRQNPTGTWEDLSGRGYCSVPEGKWYYYSFMGDLQKTETYVNGKLVNTQ